MISGNEGRFAQLAAAAHQVPDGASRKAEGLCDGRGVLPALVASGDGLTERKGSGCWHESSSRWVEKQERGSQHIAPAQGGKTICRISAAKLCVVFRGKTLCRVTRATALQKEVRKNNKMLDIALGLTKMAGLVLSYFR